MIAIRLDGYADFAEWRGHARALLAHGIEPSDVAWIGPDAFEQLLAGDAPPPAPAEAVTRVSPDFLEKAEAALCHRDPERFALCYRILWRLKGDRNLLEVASDPDIVRLRQMASAVRRDAHKMTAFVRFRKVEIADEAERERFAAWFEPDHYVLERTAPFFMRRFDGMDWAIVTPYASAVWNGQALAFGPGGRKGDVPSEDAVEAAWTTYFASIFNPARLKVAMMKSEMPVKYWRNLPEARLIDPLIRGAREAEMAMIERAASQPPARHLRQAGREADSPANATDDFATLSEAHDALASCRRCPLYEQATQPVFGEGPADAEIVFVGEQPGDQEDLAGRPFVGPAGQVFDGALAEAGIDRSRVYVTNAVKHFKFVPRGKRRLHQKPDGSEIAACNVWLSHELRLVRPRIIVALGATAAQSLMGRSATISKLRGAPIAREDGSVLFVTNHPSYLLRIPDRALAASEREKFIADLALVAQAIAGPAAAADA
ncbi:DNA polymerase [Devosia enhydra]|uniref:Type-4 uracil-DNA glycosylase n=1 Tax=Devosia enhydra TaxID=665118 RepID=A0A1K2HWM2_9HYPH|nr:UdgX family uracil-DNA binding protein [Devosia enhydra]SFZ83449.1 DNA polymerase [Devosia enhydra]